MHAHARTIVRIICTATKTGINKIVDICMLEVILAAIHHSDPTPFLLVAQTANMQGKRLWENRCARAARGLTEPISRKYLRTHNPMFLTMTTIKEKMAERTKFVDNWFEREAQLEGMKKGIADLLNLARCTWPPERALPEHITKICKEVIDKKPDYRFFGLPELRRAIAEKLERENGVDVDSEKQVLITNGGMEAIYLAIFTFINHGDEFVMGNPGYVNAYESNILMAGGRLVHVPVREERNFELDPTDVEKKITSHTKIISVTSPENPTGAVMKKNDLAVIAEIAKKHDLVVFSNEIYEKLVYGGKRNVSIASLPDMEDRTLTINGVSKGYDLHGFRVGYLAGPEAAISRMKNMQSHLSCSINDVGQHAALAALRGPQGWIKDAVKEFEGRRNFLVKELNRIDGVKCLMPDGSMFAFPNIKEFGMSSFEFMKYLLEKARVWVHPGTLFGPYGEGYLRVSFSRSQEVLTEALERIKAALENL